MDCWKTLGIAATTDRKAVKRAYAKLLKQTRPDTHPEAYQQLRAAFDHALQLCRDSSSQAGVNSVKTKSPLQNTELTANKIRQKDEPAPRPHETSLPPVRLEERTGDMSGSTPPVDDHHNAQQRKQALKQQAEKIARAAAEQVFRTDTEEDALRVFKSVIEGEGLLNLQARATFDRICLHTLCHWDKHNTPYRLIAAAGAEFRWFVERHSDAERRRRVEYLQARLQINRQYRDTLLAASQSRLRSERTLAKLLLGPFRPRVFHLMRFVGHYNRAIDKYTVYFSQAVDRGLCPELDNANFHWWRAQLARTQLTLWQGVVALIAMLFITNLNIWPAGLAPTLHGTLLASGIALLWLALWSCQVLYRRWQPLVAEKWHSVQNLRQTDLALSTIFVVSVLLWRHFQTVDNIDWLIALALAASTLLFNRYGTVMVLIGAGLYFICYALIDPQGQYPELASLALIVGFLSHKILLWSLHVMPTRTSTLLNRHSLFFYSYACGLTITLSLIYLVPTTR